MHNVRAILGPSLDDFGSCAVYLLHLLAKLGPSWGYLGGSWGLLGSTWGYLGSCWTYVGDIFGCLGASPSTYSSNVENTYLIEILTSLSLGTCRASTRQPETQHPNMFMTHRKSIPHQNANIAPARPPLSEHAPTRNPTPKHVHDT